MRLRACPAVEPSDLIRRGRRKKFGDSLDYDEKTIRVAKERGESSSL